MQITGVDIKQIETKGLTIAHVEQQIEIFKREIPFVTLREAAKLNNHGTEAKTKIIHEHRPNSCGYCFRCTFDNSRNKLRTFTGSDCVKEIIIGMDKIHRNAQRK